MVSRSDDLIPLLVPPVSGKGLSFSQGILRAWNPDTFENQVEFKGITMTNVPVAAGVDALSFELGGVVGMLGWNPGGGAGSWWILGKINVPPLDDPVEIKGGNLIITDGDIIVLADDGSVAVRISRTPAGGGQIVTYHPNGVAHTIIGQLVNSDTNDVIGQGVLVQQDDESDLFGVAPLVTNGPTLVRIRDDSNNLVFTTDESGEGLGRPYLQTAMYPSNTGTFQTTVNAGYTQLWRGRLRHTHPAFTVSVLAGTDGGTSGNVRITLAGSAVGSPINVTGGIAFHTFTVTNPIFSHYAFSQLGVEAQRTGGGGNVYVGMYGVESHQTP